jgi:hypothetical protein
MMASRLWDTSSAVVAWQALKRNDLTGQADPTQTHTDALILEPMMKKTLLILLTAVIIFAGYRIFVLDSRHLKIFCVSF